MNKLLTISIAAYNVEKTLEKTLNSLYDERILNDIEVLIIDDGSKDDTASIGIYYENKAPNTFKYIKKENGGHGSTINKGIELASGKYFKVIDGDDWVDTETLVTFIGKLKHTNSDMILTNFTEVYPNYEKKVNLVSGMEKNVEYHWDDSFYIRRVVLHTLTIKTELLKKNNVNITENCFYVDVEYVVWSIYVSNTLEYYDLYLYMYRMGNEGQSVNKKNMLKNVKMQEKVSYKLVTLYNDFIKNRELTGYKEKVFFNTFKRSIGSTMRTYLLLDNTREAKKNIIRFDSEINVISKIAFKRLYSDKFIRVLRFNNYKLTSIIKKAYGIWVKRYE